MADWNTLHDFTALEVPTAGHFDDIVENIEYLLNSRVMTRRVIVGSGNVTKTGAGSDSFTDVDATDASITITPKSTRVEVVFQGGFLVGANTFYLDWFCAELGASGTRATEQYTGTNTNGLISGTNTTAQQQYVRAVFTGLTPDTLYTFKLRWRQSNTANTITWIKAATAVSSITAREI